MFAMRLANELDKGIIRAAAGVSAGSTIAFLSSRSEDRRRCASDERDANPIDLRKLSAQLRGEAI
jgi:hypothetical protein